MAALASCKATQSLHFVRCMPGGCQQTAMSRRGIQAEPGWPTSLCASQSMTASGLLYALYTSLLCGFTVNDGAWSHQCLSGTHGAFVYTSPRDQA